MFGSDLCDAFGKPAQLTMVYTGDGDDATSHSQDATKVVVTGDPNDATPVYIVASQDPLGGGDVFFTGTVELGEAFVIDATTGGEPDLHSATHVTVYDAAGGTVLQEIEFHTSCSQPLFLGDQFGSVQLADFVDADGNGPSGVDPGTGGGEIVFDSYSFKGREFKVRLTNTGTETLTIVQVDLTFPEATNGLWAEFKKGRSKIWDPDTGLGSPATIGTADFTGHLDKLDIDPDKTNEYKFKFENEALTNIADYSATFTFSDGSTITVGG